MVKPKSLPRKPKASSAISLSREAASETERKILAAARKEFAAKGLGAARTQAIAADAGVNKALLHYYYRNKENLYRMALQDLMQSVWGKVRREFERQEKADDLESLLNALVSTYIRTLAANPEFAPFFLREITAGGLSFQAVLKDVLKNFGDVPMRLLNSLKAETTAGRVRKVDPVHFFMNIMGMCVLTFLVKPVLERLGPELGVRAVYDEKFIDARIHSITDMVFNGISIKR